jgi:NADPH:quinone reductase-like Zn-dependent oxidoreductase
MTAPGGLLCRRLYIQKFGGPENLVIEEIPEPGPKAGHVVIQVILSRLLQEDRT